MTAAAVIARRERHIVEVFVRHHATTADTSRPLGALGVDESLPFHRLVRMAVIRPGREPGTYYVDEMSWTAERARRKRMMLVVLVIVVIGLIGSVLATRAAVR